MARRKLRGKSSTSEGKGSERTCPTIRGAKESIDTLAQPTIGVIRHFGETSVNFNQSCFVQQRRRFRPIFQRRVTSYPVLSRPTRSPFASEKSIVRYLPRYFGAVCGIVIRYAGLNSCTRNTSRAKIAGRCRNVDRFLDITRNASMPLRDAFSFHY